MLRQTMRRLLKQGRPTDVGECGGWLLPAAVVLQLVSRRGRYGGRAESGMKKTFCQGMLTDMSVPRSGRYRYLVEVSGLADEAICSLYGIQREVLYVAGVIWVCKSPYRLAR